MSTNDFAKLAQDKFSFLVSEYSFCCVEATNYVVRFESDKVFVSVRYDASRSFELDVEVGELNVLYGGEERPFNLGEILRLEGAEKKERYTFFQASEPEALTNCTARLALLLSTYGVEFLKGNKYSFKRLSTFREKECNQYALETELTDIRRKVQVAWKDKNYSRVVELYQPVEDVISEAEKKKLAFAKKQIK